MIETIFWDTTAFIALGNTRDELHQSAIKVSHELAKNQAHVLTTDAILVEIANAFSKASSRPVAWRLIEAIQASVALQAATIVHVDVILWQRGWQLYRTRSDKNWGLTDCISFVVMQDYGIKRAFTQDHHFEQAGFVRLLK